MKLEEIQELYRLSVEQNEDRGLRAMIRKIAVLCIALEVFSLKEFKENAVAKDGELVQELTGATTNEDNPHHLPPWSLLSLINT